MRRTIWGLAFVTILWGLAAMPALATQRGGSAKRTVVTTHGPKATAATIKAPALKGQTLKGATTSKGATMKSTKSQAPKSAGQGGAAKHTSATTGTGKKTTGTTSGGSAGSTTPSGTWTPDNPVAEKLSTKANLLNRVKSSLPAGTDLNAATAGFKNFGQFVAAVNVSNNLGIPFADLRAAMTGTKMDGTSTGQSPLSLGQAIHQLKPGVNAEAEAQKAEAQANQQINTTSTSSTKPPKGKSKSSKRGIGATSPSGGGA